MWLCAYITSKKSRDLKLYIKSLVISNTIPRKLVRDIKKIRWFKTPNICIVLAHKYKIKSSDYQHCFPNIKKV